MVWFGWYRLYREVLGILITVGRHDEALLLAEASLKVRVDSKQKDQDYQYRQQMQSVVLAIALSTRQFDRAYPILKGKESVFGELTSFGESSIFGELPNFSQTDRVKQYFLI